MSLPTPITRKESYLAAIAGEEVQVPEKPITREEAYLDAIVKGGGGGEIIVDPVPTEGSTNAVSSGGTYTALQGKLDASEKGTASGVAELDANGKVLSSQLPSFVDDVVEGYYDSETDRFYEESTFETVIDPVGGKSWVDIPANKSYRWTGSAYVRVDEGVQLGETSNSAFRGDWGKALKDTMGTGTLDTTAQTVIPAINEVKDDMPTALSDLTDDATHRLVTDTEKSTWNGIDKFNNNMLPNNLNAYTNNGVRTIYQSVMAYINGLSGPNKPRGFVQFYIAYDANAMPSDLPSHAKWNYAWGEIYFRNGYVDAAIILHPFIDDSMIIKQVLNSQEKAWHTILTDVSTGLSDVTKLKYLNNVTSDIQIQINAKVEIQNNAGFHNSIYRGKFLGTEVTAEQYAAIANGTFDDMYIGDYWIINGVIWRIAAFDYWLNTGDTNCTTHHVVIVPDTNLDSQKMNDSNVTTGGYVGSKMYTSYITTARNKVISAFGSANILSHRQLFSNAVDGNYASSWAWYDSTIDLMSESMVYGAPIGGKAKVDSINFNIGIDKAQLPLFALDPSMIAIRANWWLRDVVSSAIFAAVAYHGYATSVDATNPFGVRPAFGIKAQV